MRRWARVLRLACAVAVFAAHARGEPREHVVVEGQTLGGIARRYDVSTEQLARANGMRPSDVLAVGRRLVIPAAPPPARAAPPPEPGGYVVVRGDTLGSIALRHRVSLASLARANGLKEGDLLRVGRRLRIPPEQTGPEEAAVKAPAAGAPDRPVPHRLDLPGLAPVHYYEPEGRGRLGLRPVIFYLHGRGGDPAGDCRRWAPLARRHGWLVCPSGAGYHGGGRTWNNDWAAGQAAVTASLDALRTRFGRRVQLYGNTLIGFSEGAFVAMNVGVRAPRTFSRWLILGASDGYLGPGGKGLVARSRASLRRVVLLTGEQDAVVPETRRAGAWLEQSGVPLRLLTPASLAHEVALEREPALYRDALAWLEAG